MFCMYIYKSDLYNIYYMIFPYKNNKLIFDIKKELIYSKILIN